MRILLIVLVAILPFCVRAQPSSSIDPPAGEKRLSARLEICGTRGQAHHREGEPRR